MATATRASTGILGRSMRCWSCRSATRKQRRAMRRGHRNTRRCLANRHACSHPGLGAIRPENRGKFESRSDLELIVAAVLRRLVVAPAHERRGVAEAVALHVVVLHFAHPFDAQRLPREILAGAPPAMPARHALPDCP